MIIRRIITILVSLFGMIGISAWWRWRVLRNNRVPAPKAKNLIRNPDIKLSLHRDGNTLCVEWDASSQRTEIFLSDTSDKKHQKQISMTVENQNFALFHGIDSRIRYQVELHLDNNKILHQTERILPLKSVANFRDIGGYQTGDGYLIRWNRVYRSSALDNLSVEDSDYLEALGLKLACDVRTVEEHQAYPDKVPDSIEVQNIPPSSGDNVLLVLARLLFEPYFLENLLLDLYQRVMIEGNPQVFREIFERLADSNSLPILIHCAAGKDRTGITIALLLAFLGVSDETIIADYTLSNHYYLQFKTITSKSLAQLSLVGLTESDFDYLLIADGTMIQKTLDYVRNNYGSVEQYLTSYAGISHDTLSAIRDNLLE